MKFKSSEWTEVRVIQEETPETSTSPAESIETPVEAPAIAATPADQNEFLHQHTASEQREAPILIAKPGRSYIVIKRVLVIVMLLVVIVIGTLAAGVRKIYYLMEPHLANEPLPIPVLTTNNELLDQTTAKRSAIMLWETPENNSWYTFTENELNNVLSTTQTDHNKLFVTLPADNQLRLHRSRRVPVILSTSLSDKRRFNTILDLETSLQNRHLSVFINKRYIGSHDLTDSLQTQRVRKFELSFNTPMTQSITTNIPLTQGTITKQTLFLSTQ